MYIESSLFSKHKEILMLDQKKRKFTRIHFQRQVQLDFVNGVYDRCRIKNLSLTGMFAMGSFLQQEGEPCLVNLLQKGTSTSVCMQAAAKVVRTSDEGIALEFTSMSYDSYMFLQMTLLYEADEPLVIGLELPENCPFEITDQPPVSPEANYSSL